MAIKFWYFEKLVWEYFLFIYLIFREFKDNDFEFNPNLNDLLQFLRSLDTPNIYNKMRYI